MLKHLLIGAALLTALPASAQVHVRGYTRSDGTYVAPHTRSAPDSSTYNNRSSYSAPAPTYSQPRPLYGAPPAQRPCSGYGCAGQLSAANGQVRSTYVQGYFRADGTYVPGYVRSSPQ